MTNHVRAGNMPNGKLIVIFAILGALGLLCPTTICSSHFIYPVIFAVLIRRYISEQENFQDQYYHGVFLKE